MKLIIVLGRVCQLRWTSYMLRVCREVLRRDLVIESDEVASVLCFFFSSRRRHTRLQGDWSSDVCSSDLEQPALQRIAAQEQGLARLQAARLGQRQQQIGKLRRQCAEPATGAQRGQVGRGEGSLHGKGCRVADRHSRRACVFSPLTSNTCQETFPCKPHTPCPARWRALPACWPAWPQPLCWAPAPKAPCPSPTWPGPSRPAPSRARPSRRPWRSSRWTMRRPWRTPGAA